MTSRTPAAVAAVALATSLAAGCGGHKDGTDTGSDPASCNDVVTERLGAVETTRWPDGLAEALPVYQRIAGRWSATSSCGSSVTVKFTTVLQEDLQVVTTPWPNTTTACGCETDPSFPADNQLGAVALTEDFQYFVEAYDDPALDAISITGRGTLFGPSQPLAFRGCAVDDVDPVLQSAYDQVSTIVRIDANGELSGTFVLTPAGGSPDTCELSGFDLIEGG